MDIVGLLILFLLIAVLGSWLLMSIGVRVSALLLNMLWPVLVLVTWFGVVRKLFSDTKKDVGSL